MNNSDSYPNKDGVVSATWPDLLCAMGDYPYYAYRSVPQSTYPGRVYAPGYPSTSRSFIPDLNAANDAAFSLAPTTEMGAFANLPTQADCTSQVSSQYVGTSTWTYPGVPQDVLDPWSMPTLCMFHSCIRHDPSYSPDANPKSPT
jgi:hypothetical protein